MGKVLRYEVYEGNFVVFNSLFMANRRSGVAL